MEGDVKGGREGNWNRGGVTRKRGGKKGKGKREGMRDRSEEKGRRRKRRSKLTGRTWDLVLLMIILQTERGKAPAPALTR